MRGGRRKEDAERDAIMNGQQQHHINKDVLADSKCFCTTSMVFKAEVVFQVSATYTQYIMQLKLRQNTTPKYFTKAVTNKLVLKNQFHSALEAFLSM